MMDLRLRGHSQCFLVNMLHLIQKHFGYIQLWLLVLQLKCGQNQAGSDLTSHIRFGSVLWKRAQIRLHKTGLGFGQMHLVQNCGSKPVCKNHRARFWQNAISLLPVSHFQTQLCSSADNRDHTVQNQPRSDLVLADRVGFWPSGSSPEASRCARIIRPASGQNLAEPDWMWIGSGTFTWLLLCRCKGQHSSKRRQRQLLDWVTNSVTDTEARADSL